MFVTTTLPYFFFFSVFLPCCSLFLSLKKKKKKKNSTPEMEERKQSRYVKLTKDHSHPLEDITPGELNQPIDIPQLAVRKCPTCRQALPESYAPPADEPWTTGIFGCAEDRESCLTGLFCPCVLFGRNVESLSEDGTPWTKPCICHAICVEGGISLAIATAAATFLFPGLDPGTSFLIAEGLFFTWWICGTYTGQVRHTLQIQRLNGLYHLEVHTHVNITWRTHPATHVVFTAACTGVCALCQEHREMKGRLSDNAFSQMTVVNPPPIQEMKSNDEKENPETSSANNNDNVVLEMQAI